MLDMITQHKYSYLGLERDQVFCRRGNAQVLGNRQEHENPPAVLRNTAKRKLLMLDAAIRLEDLRVPPGNQLHALKGDRAHQHAIRINDQYRICFRWKETDAYDVEITDYH